MTDSFHIDPVRCQAAHAAIQTAITSKITPLLESVAGDARVLFEALEGDARDALHTRQTQWQNDSQAILEKLQQINRALDESIQIYVSADARAAAQIAGGA